ncbi:MAG: hypothetical protein AB8E15_12120 [Bdellovibrionales bacterium]
MRDFIILLVTYVVPFILSAAAPGKNTLLVSGASCSQKYSQTSNSSIEKIFSKIERRISMIPLPSRKKTVEEYRLEIENKTSLLVTALKSLHEKEQHPSHRQAIEAYTSRLEHDSKRTLTQMDALISKQSGKLLSERMDSKTISSEMVKFQRLYDGWHTHLSGLRGELLALRRIKNPNAVEIKLEEFLPADQLSLLSSLLGISSIKKEMDITYGGNKNWVEVKFFTPKKKTVWKLQENVMTKIESMNKIISVLNREFSEKYTFEIWLFDRRTYDILLLKELREKYPNVELKIIRY